MTKPYIVGQNQAGLRLGFYKVANGSLSALEELAKPSFLNKIDGLFVTPKPPPTSAAPSADKVISKERTYLRKRYNVATHLSGSMPLNLHVPGDVDIDLFVRAESPAKFKSIIRKLRQNPRYTSSPFNKENAGYHVFQRPANGVDDYPVDLAVAYGAPGKEYVKTLKAKKSLSRTLPDDLRERLVAKKSLLKNTPLDFNHKRYKAWKRGLDAALGGDYRLTRDEVSALKKVGTVIDLKDEEQLEKFRRFTKYKDMYGHRTHNIDSVLENQGLFSALEALKRGKLKSYEAGSSVGTHQVVEHNNLSSKDLSKIEKAMLTADPDKSVFEDIAESLGRTEDAVTADFLRQDFGKIKDFLQKQEDPEEFRKDHFSISKLGPNIFVTKGGILDTDAYGDSAVLLRSRTAKKSPFANFVTDEYIIPSKRVFEPRKLRIGSGYVLAPKSELKKYDAAHPLVKFVATEDIPDDIKEDIYKPTHSLKETWQRWVPAALSGELSVKQTR